MRSNLLAALAFAAGCSQPPANATTATSQPPATLPPSSDPPPVASVASPPPVTPPSATPPAKPPLPPFASLRTLMLRVQQGGPSTPKCPNSVVYEIEIDVAKNGLVLRDCNAGPDTPPGSGKLVPRTKKLTPQQRKTIEDAYAKLERAPGGNCAADAGPTTIELTKTDGSKESYLGQSCGNPPPDIARGLAEFSSTTATIAFAR